MVNTTVDLPHLRWSFVCDVCGRKAEHTSYIWWLLFPDRIHVWLFVKYLRVLLWRYSFRYVPVRVPFRAPDDDRIRIVCKQGCPRT